MAYVSRRRFLAGGLGALAGLTLLSACTSRQAPAIDCIDAGALVEWAGQPGRAAGAGQGQLEGERDDPSPHYRERPAVAEGLQRGRRRVYRAEPEHQDRSGVCRLRRPHGEAGGGPRRQESGPPYPARAARGGRVRHPGLPVTPGRDHRRDGRAREVAGDVPRRDRRQRQELRAPVRRRRLPDSLVPDRICSRRTASNPLRPGTSGRRWRRSSPRTRTAMAPWTSMAWRCRAQGRLDRQQLHAVPLADRRDRLRQGVQRHLREGRGGEGAPVLQGHD